MVFSVQFHPYRALADKREIAVGKQIRTSPAFRLMNKEDLLVNEPVNPTYDPLLGQALELALTFRGILNRFFTDFNAHTGFFFALVTISENSAVRSMTSVPMVVK